VGHAARNFFYGTRGRGAAGAAEASAGHARPCRARIQSNLGVASCLAAGGEFASVVGRTHGGNA
jgi:hypothetical protein